MRKIYIITLALLALIPTARAEDGVVLLLNDGTNLGFAFSAKPVITTAETLELSITNGERVSYNYQDVKYVYFGKVSTGIDNVRSDVARRVTFHVEGQMLRVEGLSAGERVTAYTTDGRRVDSRRADADGSSLTLSLPSSGHNIYIIKTSTGVSFKFSH